jgi:hypothetical protein
VPSASPTSTGIRAAAAPRRTWLVATAAYGVTVPTTADWLRHGLTVRLAMPWGRWPVAAFVDAAFTTEPSVTIDGRAISARIWPVGAGVALALERPRWHLAGGPRLSLQIVDAEAQAGDQTGSARRYAAGLGALVEGAWRFSRPVALTGAVTVEALVPRLAFAAGGPDRTDLGWVQFGFWGGLAVFVP